VQGTTTNTVTGNVFLPQTPEVFSYDADGNLTNDGHYSYTWDAENRLLFMQTVSTLPTAAWFQIQMEYDWQGRRVRKTVSIRSGNKWVVSTDAKFIYDGWNCVLEANASDAVQRRYMWGLDLSGSGQGAGGVGGMLAVQDVAGTNGVNFVAFDGNGNVAALVRSKDGTVSANYEYGPFGEVLRSSGTMAKANPIRFSTKYQDDESDLVYYGYRYYNPTTGRWNERDMAGENACPNLYVALKNNCENDIDVLGLDSERNDQVIAATKGKIERWLNNPDRTRQLPFASALLKNWYTGAPLNPYTLSDEQVKTMFATEQGKAAINELDKKLLEECKKLQLNPRELRPVKIKFHGRPQEGGTGVKQEFRQPGIHVGLTLPDFSIDEGNAHVWDLFLSFHNAYFDAEYDGKCCIDKAGKLTFVGDARYRIFDMYIFPDRPWSAIPRGEFPSDSDMWQVQQYGGAKPFDIEGFYERKNRHIPNRRTDVGLK
jgi:RHS repeat-associated protein